MRSARERLALTVIVMHLAVATLHGVAHGVLAVPAGHHAGLLVIAAAVYVGPLIALAALLGGRRVAGALVLSASMAAALSYGLAFHYILNTPDHVAYAPRGFRGDAFRLSAGCLAILEVCGLAAGALLLSFPSRRRVSGARDAGAAPATRALRPGCRELD